jgi:hypothetical protein
MKKYHRNNIANLALAFDKAVAKLIRHQAGDLKSLYTYSNRVCIHQYDLDKFGIHRWQAIRQVKTFLTKAQKAKLVRGLLLRDDMCCCWAYPFKAACMRACSKKPNLI